MAQNTFFSLLRHCHIVLFDPVEEDGAGLLLCKKLPPFQILQPCWPDKLNSVLSTRVQNIELPHSVEGGNSIVYNQTVCKGNRETN